MLYLPNLKKVLNLFFNDIFNNNSKVIVDALITFEYIKRKKGENCLHDIIFYKDGNEREPVYEYLQQLSKRNDKDSRIKLQKIRDYVKILSKYGTQIGEPYVKHLDRDIWELRPLRDRILFAGYIKGSYVLLHHFVKKTRKTPYKEIMKAKKEFADFVERNVEYDN